MRLAPAARLFWLAAAFAAVVAAQVGLFALAFTVMNGARAYVGGEGLWSKGQKDAVYALSRYAHTGDPTELEQFKAAIAIPLGDRMARMELLKPDYDPAVVEAGFVQGGNAAEDVPALTFLFRYFQHAPRVAEPIRIWAQAEADIDELLAVARELEQVPALDEVTRAAALARIDQANARLTPLERDFSAAMGSAARWATQVTLVAVGSLSLVLVLLGFTTAAWIGREQQRAMAQALQASTELAGSVIATADDAFIGMDAGGCVTEWNRQAELTFGWSRAEAVGRPLSDLIVPPRHQRAHRDGLARYLATGEHRVLNQRLEISALHRSGREFPVELTIWVLREPSGVRFNAFLHDITERRRAVQRLEAQRAAAAALLSASSPEAAGPAVLRAVCEALGWDFGAIWLPVGGELRCASAWAAPGRSVVKFENATRQRTFPPGRGLPGRVWQSGAPVWVADVAVDSHFVRAAEAAADDLHGAFAVPLHGGPAELHGVIEFFSREVLAPDEKLLEMMATLGGMIGQYLGRMRAERELATRVDELARSNEELERFAYVASHDLQEPLRTVGSYTQLLLRRYGSGDKDAAEFSAFITAAVQRMRALIDGLLAYSRVSRQAVPREPADLGALLRTALADLRDAIERTRAQVEVGPLPVLAVNPAQLVQLWQNLIGNALKFHGADPPRVEVSARPAGSFWEFSVRDHGIGIDPQHLERIFVLFQRLHTQDAYPGSGLGLAICKRIVERHGGRIWAEPASPGTVFRFTLPAV